MDKSSEVATRTETTDALVSAPTKDVSKSSAAKSKSSVAKAKAAVTSTKAKSTKRRTPEEESHEARVERVTVELGDLLDEHDAELREIKDRVTQALARSSQLRKAVKSALKNVSHNAALDSELADYRKKFDSLRNLMG